MYLDPGFGSMLIQALIAIIAAVGAYFIAMKKKLSGMFNKNNQGESTVKENIPEEIKDKDERI